MSTELTVERVIKNIRTSLDLSGRPGASVLLDFHGELVFIVKFLGGEGMVTFKLKPAVRIFGPTLLEIVQEHLVEQNPDCEVTLGPSASGPNCGLLWFSFKNRVQLDKEPELPLS